MIENFSKMKVVKLLLSFVLSLITVVWASASHLRAGEITVTRLGCTSREVLITITVYTNTASDVKFGEDGILYFGDGTSFVIPRVENVAQPQLGPNIGIATYSKRHLYGSNDSYLISYVEPNRNGGVLNMNDSFYTTFYLETRFSLAVLGCNNSPRLKIPPIDQACAGVAFFHNPGAYDINGPLSPTDSISYESVIPYRDRGLPVAGYISPEKLGGNAQNENENGPATFTIDPVDGTMIWDAPDPDYAGEYNVAFNVIEWRKLDGVWKQIGYVRRDMQIIVNGDCTNERPELEVPDDVCVVAGSNVNDIIRGYDQPSGSEPLNDIKIQAFSEILVPTFTSPATVDPLMDDEDGFLPSPLEVEFNWDTKCDHIKGQPYDVVFKITDNGAPTKLATFRTWKITVVAPAPVLDTAIVPAGQRNVQLTWFNYDCGSITDEKKVMQIWRKVDNTNYTPGNCDTGMPESLGYTLIATTAITDTSFLDTNNGLGLERGVGYCYRLVAIFGNRGAESYVSNEVCIEPMKIAAPLITKVTVDRTGEANGEITAVWIAPLNPLPAVTYLYELQRAEGDGFISVSPKMEMTADTLAFTDQSDLNTLDRQYFYRVMLYIDGTPTPVDSSSVASSVRLTLTTSDGIINLTWRATVPWSNQIPGLVHDIYRKEVTSAETLAELEFYESVNVTSTGLRYTDDGLNPSSTYCYAVIARGSYGNDNPKVFAVEPLENTSQINCAMPVVVEPPCAPIIAAFADPCKDFFEEYTCNSAVFSTVVRWSRPKNCIEDIVAYEVYRLSTSDRGVPNEDALPVAVVTDTFAIIQNLSSLANCYWIKSVNRAGGKSNFSDMVCSENCPNFELPNVFTPNGDNCNDTFDAYGVIYDVDEGADCIVKDDDSFRCARFVERVDFKVYNRWGKKIYDYVGQLGGSENPIHIRWNGKDNSGKDLPSGIYFYSADVTFLSTKSAGTVKTIKGWVHLVR